jgi:hypothetical protein
MTTILFVSRYYTGALKNSLSRKFAGQIRAARELGMDVWHFEVDERGIYLCHDRDRIRLRDVDHVQTSGAMNSAKLYGDLYTGAVSALSIIPKIDIAYFRRGLASLAYFGALRAFHYRRIKIVMEVPTHPRLGEIRSQRSLLRRALLIADACLQRVYAAGKVDLFVVIGHSVADRLAGRTAVNAVNGIDCRNLPTRHVREPDGSIHLLALASMARWQGYDRLIRGLEAYYFNGGNTPVHVHLVGDEADGSLGEWRELAVSLSLANFIHIEGALYDAALDRLFDECDLGVASLALHRTGRQATSTLKVCEYMARGIPFVYATPEIAVPPDFPYALKVAAGEEPLDIYQIVRFAQSLCTDEQVVQSMRTFARDTMTWEAQLGRVLSHLTISESSTTATRGTTVWPAPLNEL